MLTKISAIVLFLWSFQANAAEFYLDLGLGWLHELPAEGEVKANGDIILESEVAVHIDSPFLDFGFGVEWGENWYTEVRRFGIVDNPKESITIFKIGKRIYF